MSFPLFDTKDYGAFSLPPACSETQWSVSGCCKFLWLFPQSSRKTFNFPTYDSRGSSFSVIGKEEI